MLGLFFFGRDVEIRYGRREYLFYYLSAIVFSSFIWSISQTLSGTPALVLGASGGVAAVLILFALNYPHRTVLFMFIIPMPMWVLACFMIGMDVMGAVGAATQLRGGRIAFTAHLAGAAYAFIYFRTGWSPGNWLGNKLSGVSLKRKPNLRVHQPSDSGNETENEME